MAKYIIAVIFCSIFFGTARGQRNIPGLQSVEITTGTVNGMVFRTSKDEKRVHLSAGFSTINRKGYRWMVNAVIIRNDIQCMDKIIPVSLYALDVGYGKSILSDGQVRFCLNFFGKLLFGYQNHGPFLPDSKEFFNRKDGMVIAPGIKIEMELFLNNKISFPFYAQPYLKFGTGHTEGLILVGVGLRFWL